MRFSEEDTTSTDRDYSAVLLVLLCAAGVVLGLAGLF